jgi:hypothetical protein
LLLAAAAVTLWIVAPWIDRSWDGGFSWSAGLGRTYECKDRQRWGDVAAVEVSAGHELNQGWTVCVDEGTQLWHIEQRKCVVYSFGINHEWGFDLAAGVHARHLPTALRIARELMFRPRSGDLALLPCRSCQGL